MNDEQKRVHELYPVSGAGADAFRAGVALADAPKDFTGIALAHWRHGWELAAAEAKEAAAP